MNVSLARLTNRSQAVLNEICLASLYPCQMTIGARLIQLRLAHKPKKLTQDKIGEFCGVSKSAVAQWESGATVPEVDRLIKLREKVTFSLDWLLTGKGDIGQVYLSDPRIDLVVAAMRGMESEDADRLVAISGTFPAGRKRFDTNGITDMGFEQKDQAHKKRKPEQ